MRTTWDGLPISHEPPYGATVVVYRDRGRAPEVLLLHRAHHGPDHAGDWTWTPPTGSRLPDEPIDQCARRELPDWRRLTRGGVEERVLDGAHHYSVLMPPQVSVVCMQLGLWLEAATAALGPRA
jgi:hypothetical protein